MLSNVALTWRRTTSQLKPEFIPQKSKRFCVRFPLPIRLPHPRGSVCFSGKHSLLLALFLGWLKKTCLFSRYACHVPIKPHGDNCCAFLEDFPKITVNRDNSLQAQRELCRNVMWGQLPHWLPGSISLGSSHGLLPGKKVTGCSLSNLCNAWLKKQCTFSSIKSHAGTESHTEPAQ